MQDYLKIRKKNIIIDDKQRDQYERKEFAKKVSFLMQFSEVPSGMTVYDLVCYGRLPYRKMFASMNEEDYRLVDWVLYKANIYEYKDKLVSQLSGGERQRAFLALSLAQTTKILILDEPTNHLDLKYQYETMKLIRKLNDEEDITIICVLHDITQAMRYSDEVVVMKDGCIVAHGRPEDCITHDIIHDVYDVQCDINKINGHSVVSIV